MVLYAVDIKVVDKDTLIIENRTYENYGIDPSGFLFEVHPTDKIILRHYGDGVKLIDNMILDDREYFYLKSDRNIKPDTFKYQSNPDMTLSDIRNTIMRWMYLNSPHLTCSTLMGWTSDDMHPINDVNWMDSYVMLDNDKRYSIIRKKSTVRIFESNKRLNWMYFNEEKYVVEFELDRELFGEADALYYLRRNMSARKLASYNMNVYIDLIERYKILSEKVDTYIGGLAWI